ncbi:ribosome silencing factor [Burkholderiaceae bacterium FT117]|uniref:ribosome silencing factor n=1 Tax=Zeimonas sediminis TaxID=2944268 RepID=UPI0023430B11|nr:ribosome silencing factor [Zeimonas sediminis]MCM5570366.1 ribosome silencing factor [Zeimonas sediminis]
MDIRKLQRVIVDALEDVKAQDIRVFNTVGQTELFDRVILATGTSNRQTRALASHVRDEVKKAGGQVVSMEGEETGEWVLVDLGDAVVHIMQPGIRDYYRLEELWGEKPVRLKPAESPAAKAAAAMAQARKSPDAAKPPAKKPAARKPAAKKPAAAKRPTEAKKPTAAKAGVAAKKPAGKKPAAKKAAAR